MADRTVTTRLRADVTGAVAGLRTFKAATLDATKTLSARVEANRSAIDDLAQGATALGGALLFGFGAAVKVMARFEQQMSAVGAAAGVSGSQLDALRQQALQAGKDTAFSATQAAQAQTELAKAGLTASDILGGALQGSLDLAAAGTLDLGRAAEIATQTMSTFHLAASDTSHIADVLAAGANASTASVETLSQALAQGGQVAAQTGLSLEETVGALAAFDANALRGSDAGTSLKTMLQRLVVPTAESSATMARLGLAAFDASGRFVGLSAFAGQLQTKLSGLTDQQRNAALATIFGADAVRAASVLYSLGAAGVDKYTSAVNDMGAAQRTASQLTDNLAGDWERLTGSLETALIESGSKGNAVIRELVQTADGAVGVFTALPGPVQAVGVAVAAVGGAALVAGGGLLFLIPRLVEARAAMAALNISAATLARGLKFGAFGIGVTVALGVLINRFQDAARAADEFADRVVAAAGGDLERQIDSVNDALREQNELAGKGASLFGTIYFSKDAKVAADRADALTGRLRELQAQKDKVAASGQGLGSKLKALSESTTGAVAPTTTLEAAWADAGNAALSLEDRTKSLSTALDLFFNPTIDAHDAAARLKDALESAAEALKKTNGVLPRHAKLNSEGASAVRDYARAVVASAEAEFRRTRNTEAATRVVLQNIPALLRMAGSNRAAKADIDAMARSMGITITKTKQGTVAVDQFGNKVRILPDGKVVVITAKTAGAQSAMDSLLTRLRTLSLGTTVPIRTRVYTVRVPGLAESTPPLARPQAAGGIVEHYRMGGERHTAQIAPAGAWRVWAEPETGGEAYIPLAGSKRARSTAILEQVAARFGLMIAKPMADGAILAFAQGGLTDTADVPLSQFLSRWTEMVNPATRGDVKDATRRRKDAVEQLRKAERALAEARKRKGPGSARAVADAEARVRKERRDLAAATTALHDVERRFAAGRLRPAEQFGRALNLGVRNTGAFIANLQRLADRGFGDLARELLNMGGPEAEKIAADAVKLSNTKLAGLNRKIGSARRQQQILEDLPSILGIRSAVKAGKTTFAAMVDASGLDPAELARIIKLISADLVKTAAGRKLLADTKRQGFAAGGIVERRTAQIAPAGAWRVWAEPETGGEAYIPLAGSKRARSTAVLAETARRMGYAVTPRRRYVMGAATGQGAAAGGSPQATQTVVNLNHVPGYSTPAEVARALAHAERIRRHARRR